MERVILFGVLILVFSILVSTLGDSIAIEYEDIPTTANEEYVAVENTTVSEVLELTYEYDSLNYITVATVPLDLETDLHAGDSDTIELEEAVSDVGDAIVINYEHLVSTEIALFPAPVRALINLLPILAIAGLLAVLAGVYLKNRSA